jgi:hypothetical protein
VEEAKECVEERFGRNAVAKSLHYNIVPTS